jgi:HPr kinase/phosphorylase
MSSRATASITVEHFYKAYGERLRMELVSGEVGLQRPIFEPGINRPSLALTGFVKYFANKRIQVLGACEMTYLKSLSPRAQFQRLAPLVTKFRIPCLVLSRNFQPTLPILRLAEEHGLPVFRTSLITLRFINVATLCIDNEFAPSGTEHGTMLDIKGIGVLIRGDSGVGKSEAALALIERGYSLVADDLTRIRLLDERELSASSPELNRGYMECRGIGIINVADMFGIKSVRPEKRVDLVVTLREWHAEADEERTGLESGSYEILGIRVPHIEIYVRPGRDIARLIEVAALVEALKRIGHDPAREFNERLIAHMAGADKATRPSPNNPAPARAPAASV